MARRSLEVDRSVSVVADPSNSHNRWHPAIPPALEIDPGDEVVLECRDGFDGQIQDGATPRVFSTLELGREHPLTGPVYVRGAVPGDILAVEIVGIDPAPYGFSAVFAGVSRLSDRFGVPSLSHWHVEDGFATSPQIPGVRIAARPFLGIIGVAPSPERMTCFREREQRLADEGVMLLLPTAEFAVPADPVIANEGIRTMTPRENGGNWDVEAFGVGSTVYLPVEVDGALLSGGDPHFRQGDGEVSGAAIEASAVVTLRVGLIKASQRQWMPKTPAALQRRVAEPSGDWMITTGIPLTRAGENRSMDLMLAVDHALDQMVDRVVAEYGYDEQQAFTIVGLAVRLHVSMVVAAPNCTVTAALPVAIFNEGG